jgi:hypothetical protein
MERLQRVLAQRSGELARTIERQAGVDGPLAAKFVSVAGEELLDAYLWQEQDLDRRLSHPRNARELLGAVCAHRVAADLGMSLDAAWAALRAFVPSVLALAEGQRAAPTRRATSGSEATWRPARRGRVAALGFLQPVE